MVEKQEISVQDFMAIQYQAEKLYWKIGIICVGAGVVSLGIIFIYIILNLIF